MKVEYRGRLGLGEIRNRRKMRFSHFLTLQRGFDLPKSQMEEGNYPVVGSTSIIGYHNEYKVNPPGVVTGRSGSLGTVQYINDKYWPHNTALWVKDFKGNYPRYVYYFLQTLNLERFNSGAGVPTLNRNDLDTLEISIHDFPTQHKIASILSAYDILIENNNRRIKILEEMAQAIYREWFVNFRFPGHEKVKMMPLPPVETPLMASLQKKNIPEGWEVKTLGYIAKEVRRSVNPNDVDTQVPYFGLEHLPRKSIALSEWGSAGQITSTKLSFKRGEILFGKIRPYFHKVGIAPVDGICSSDIIVISATSSEYFSVVLLCVSSEAFVNHATQTSQGTKMPRANWNILNRYPVIVPPRSLLLSFNEAITNITDQILVLIFKNRNLRRTRDLLMPRLISGEIDVEGMDLDIQHCRDAINGVSTTATDGVSTTATDGISTTT